MARDKKKEQPVDTYLLEKIQPQGGITFMDAKYISTGGGYEACLHIFEMCIRDSLCIGITRSGKGEMYVIPSIDVYSRAEKKT